MHQQLLPLSPFKLLLLNKFLNFILSVSLGRHLSFTDRLTEKYGNMFTLPSRRALIGGTLLFGTLLGIIVYAIQPKQGEYFFGLVDGLISLAFGTTIATYIIFKIAGNDIFTFRRTSALTVVGLGFLGFGLFISTIVSRGLNNPLIFDRMYFLSCGIIVAYIYILLAVLSDVSQLKLFLLSFSQPVLILLLHSIMIHTFLGVDPFTILAYFLGFVVIGLISYALGRWFFFSIESVGKDLLGYGSVVLLKAFLDAFVLDKIGSLEKLLEVIAVRSDVEVRTLSFKSEHQRGVVVAPLIHPGPFGDLGSSKLPTGLAVQFLKDRIFPVIFHTPTTHDKDLVRTKDCDRVMQTIYSMVGNEDTTRATPLIVKKRGAITIDCQIFDDTPLIVITRSPLPTEDLPDFVNEICMKKILESGYFDGVVVDAHNVVDPTYTALSDQDKNDLEDAVSEALREAKCQEKGNIRAGFANIKLEGYSGREGIGDGGIMVTVIEVNNQKSAYISVDANNMVVGLREKIQNVLRQSGYDFSEITTTDTHVIASHSSGEAYFPLGKAIPEDILIEKMLAAVKEADSKKAECSVKFSKRRINDVYLLGNKGIENLWKVTDKTTQVAKERVVVLASLLIVSCITLYFLI